MRLVLILALGGALMAAPELADYVSQRPPFSCSTDAECAQMPDCLADPACDGGPESGAR